VLGLGNILLRDEGIGVRVIEAMQDAPLPPGVELFDGATAGIDLLNALADRRKVIVVDAIDSSDPPGTVRRLRPEELVGNAAAVSLHEFGLLETLTVARQLGCAPAEVVILGVRPIEIDAGLELSPAAAALVPQLIALVRAELEAEADREPRERSSS
jgi:hydrogenase maturation protease